MDFIIPTQPEDTIEIVMSVGEQGIIALTIMDQDLVTTIDPATEIFEIDQSLEDKDFCNAYFNKLQSVTPNELKLEVVKSGPLTQRRMKDIAERNQNRSKTHVG